MKVVTPPPVALFTHSVAKKRKGENEESEVFDCDQRKPFYAPFWDNKG